MKNRRIKKISTVDLVRSVVGLLDLDVWFVADAVEIFVQTVE